MKPNDFIPTLQRQVAVLSVGPSALRGQGKGVLAATQKFLSRVSLARLPKSNPIRFESWLDRQTNRLLDTLPLKSRPWGAARKAINLYLRDALYNQYLCRRFRMNRVESWLEIPLDSAVARGLKQASQRGELPSWPGLKGLTKSVSNQYQEFASELSNRMNIERVHLDIYLWLENR
ncbi:MAG: hypothetical protein ISS63_16130 [Desulfobacteraceae bacterium]|nr:hypothetical protein [Desulfobacteraceae bacterium]